MKEANIHYQVAQYIKIQYPNVIFRTDFAAGIKMTMGQATRHKSLQSGRAYPDLFIAQPKLNLKEDGGFIITYLGHPLEPPTLSHTYCGLYLELKQEDTVLVRPKDAKKILKGETKLRKAGDWFDDHVEEQALMLDRLRKLGYKAEFACGFESAKNIIDNYLK